MLVSLYGHNVFLSGTEQARLKDKAHDDLVKQIENLAAWVKSDFENRGNGNSYTTSSSHIVKTFNALASDVDLYCRIHGVYPDGELRRCFERDDTGDIVR